MAGRKRCTIRFPGAQLLFHIIETIIHVHSKAFHNSLDECRAFALLRVLIRDRESRWPPRVSVTRYCSRRRREWSPMGVLSLWYFGNANGHGRWNWWGNVVQSWTFGYSRWQRRNLVLPCPIWVRRLLALMIIMLMILWAKGAVSTLVIHWDGLQSTPPGESNKKAARGVLS